MLLPVTANFTHLGPLSLDQLKPGEWRRVKPAEMKLLRQFMAKKAIDSDPE